MHPIISWGPWNMQLVELPVYKFAMRERLDWAGLQNLSMRVNAPNWGISGMRFFDFFKDDTLSRTKLRLLEAAIGAKRYQRFYGHWPSELKDCVPQFMTEIPPDPFINGEKIHYLPSPPRVFSAGSNGKYEPDSHGYPRADRFKKLSMDERDWGESDVVLFLGN